MEFNAFEEHLRHPVGRGHVPADSVAGSAGGAACGDQVQIFLRLEEDRVADAGFEASGCGAVVAAGSAVVDMIRGESIFDAARISAFSVSEELGELSPGKFHAADLASDALHRALGQAAFTQAACPPVGERTLVAMSGGVDSTVAATLVHRVRRKRGRGLQCAVVGNVAPAAAASISSASSSMAATARQRQHGGVHAAGLPREGCGHRG